MELNPKELLMQRLDARLQAKAEELMAPRDKDGHPLIGNIYALQGKQPQQGSSGKRNREITCNSEWRFPPKFGGNLHSRPMILEALQPSILIFYKLIKKRERELKFSMFLSGDKALLYQAFPILRKAVAADAQISAYICRNA